MKNNTKIIKILIIVFVIIILLVSGLFIFLTTDLFKSNKTLFLKYAMQLLGKEGSFIESKVEQYYTKMIETPFENESTISFNTEQETQDNQMINQLNITLKGKVDAKNKNIEESINLNYSPQVTFPINIRYKDGLFGYQTEYVGSKYIVDDRTSSSTLSASENEDENNNEESLSEEEITDLFIKYGKIAIDQIGEDKFSKEQNGDNTVYKITLTHTDMANILKGILEELKQDQETIEKFDLDTKDIDDGLKDIEEYLNENQDKEEDSIEILLYKNSGNINKVELKYKEVIGSLEKVTQDGKIQYNAIISGEDFSVELNLSFNGLETLQNVEDNYTLKINTIDNETTTNIITYNINNKTNFVDSVEIDSFDDNNAIIYSRYDDAQIDSFSQAVSERMQQVNQMQMEQLGISSSQNPIVQAIFAPILSVVLQSQGAESINSASFQTQETDINTFNQKFELYEGTNIQGTTVRGLLTTISSNNGIQEESTNQNVASSFLNSNSKKIEEINLNGEEYEVNQQNIAALKEEIIAENYYKVEFEKNPNTGAIYRVVITPK